MSDLEQARQTAREEAASNEQQLRDLARRMAAGRPG